VPESERCTSPALPRALIRRPGQHRGSGCPGVDRGRGVFPGAQKETMPDRGSPPSMSYPHAPMCEVSHGPGNEVRHTPPTSPGPLQDVYDQQKHKSHHDDPYKNKVPRASSGMTVIVEFAPVPQVGIIRVERHGTCWRGHQPSVDSTRSGPRLRSPRWITSPVYRRLWDKSEAAKEAQHSGAPVSGVRGSPQHDESAS
jgi:hypothetical protein